jgi:hypothetical protein
MMGVFLAPAAAPSRRPLGGFQRSRGPVVAVAMTKQRIPEKIILEINIEFCPVLIRQQQ